MRSLRVTKYDPAKRDNKGAYTSTEWTEYSDVGKSVTHEEYESVERKYIMALETLLKSCDIQTLRITGLEDNWNKCPYTDNQQITTDDFGGAFKDVLRAKYWCLFESDLAYVHFGYDYYSYIGIPHISNADLDVITKNGLFVEDYKSPYHDNSI